MGPFNISTNVTEVCASIDDFRNQVYSTVYSVITVFGLMGNAFCIETCSFVPTVRNQPPIYSQLGSVKPCCVSALFHSVALLCQQGQWNLGDFLCRISFLRTVCETSTAASSS
ncbi:hypothetical protein QQF64_006506 [Cirrhinus molitorella]|uniref:Uncharacterized protein n=1 Tax=Cirrhinus molitorella TaxID=172907 RepID=A0ABR3MAE2_9TELE